MGATTALFTHRGLERTNERADEGTFFRENGTASFLAAGAVLFASLVVGASASLFLAGADAVMAAILRDFISFGLCTLAAFATALGLARAASGLRHRHQV